MRKLISTTKKMWKRINLKHGGKFGNKYIYIYLYYGTIECLNLIGWRKFSGVQLFSGKRTANVVPGSFLDRITVPYHFAKWFVISKVLKQKNYQNPDTGQTNKYSKQKDKIDSSCPYFCHKMKFYCVWKAHSLLSLPHRHTYSLHTPYKR